MQPSKWDLILDRKPVPLQAHLLEEVAQLFAQDLARWPPRIEDFDPVTGQRKRIFLNTRFANIFGYHREELVARFANHEAGLQRTEIDSLLVLLDGLQHALDDSKAAPVERYYRMFSGPSCTP